MTFEALLNEDFEFERPSTGKAPAGYVPAGLSTRIAALAICSVIASAWCWKPTLWIQPTVVGVLFGSLFLVGAAAGNVRRGSGGFAVVASLWVWFSQQVMQTLTNLLAAECTLVAVMLFGAGWAVAHMDTSAEGDLRSADRLRHYCQWTIWDLALLTTLCAFVCYTVPLLASPVVLLCQVGFVVAAGLLCSWVAYRWVFDDRWSMAKLLALLAGFVTCLVLIGSQTPTEFSLPHILAWMISGPLAVIAAQGITVLFALTAIRVDQGSLVVAASPREAQADLEDDY